MVDLTYEKIGAILNILQEVANNIEFTPKLEKEEVKCLIGEVKEADLLNEDALKDALKKDIEKYI